ncbi:MAG: substrate-binding domain-containing protein [Kiritimatiellae bacterium]|nr:substrate-binding domain-containing protein [Kiritimatiellia bacterium]
MTASVRLPIYRTIASSLREEIATRYEPGELLPSENALAERFHVNRLTLRQAVELLERDGLVRRERGRGRGTVVLDRNAEGEFAVVVQPQRLCPGAAPYYSLTGTALSDAVSACNQRWTAKLHVGRLTDDDAAHLASLDLLDVQVLSRLRGVFTFHELGSMQARLTEALVPVVFMGTTVENEGAHAAGEANRVGFDLFFLYNNLLRHLRQAGCRRIGVFSLRDREGLRVPRIRKIAATHGLSLKSEWVAEANERRAELDGYESFLRLWNTGARPDGLMVTDDTICCGVLRAALQCGVRLPEQLRLVSHANRGVSFPYHKAVTRVEFDPTAQARSAVGMMQQLLRHPRKSVPAIYLPGALVEGATA